MTKSDGRLDERERLVGVLPLDRAKRLDGEPRRAKHYHLLDVAQGVERPAARAEEIEMRLVVPAETRRADEPCRQPRRLSSIAVRAHAVQRVVQHLGALEREVKRQGIADRPRGAVRHELERATKEIPSRRAAQKISQRNERLQRERVRQRLAVRQHPKRDALHQREDFLRQPRRPALAASTPRGGPHLQVFHRVPQERVEFRAPEVRDDVLAPRVRASEVRVQIRALTHRRPHLPQNRQSHVRARWTLHQFLTQEAITIRLRDDVLRDDASTRRGERRGDRDALRSDRPRAGALVRRGVPIAAPRAGADERDDVFRVGAGHGGGHGAQRALEKRWRGRVAAELEHAFQRGHVRASGATPQGPIHRGVQQREVLRAGDAGRGAVEVSRRHLRVEQQAVLRQKVGELRRERRATLLAAKARALVREIGAKIGRHEWITHAPTHADHSLELFHRRALLQEVVTSKDGQLHVDARYELLHRRDLSKPVPARHLRLLADVVARESFGQFLDELVVVVPLRLGADALEDESSDGVKDVAHQHEEHWKEFRHGGVAEELGRLDGELEGVDAVGGLPRGGDVLVELL